MHVLNTVTGEDEYFDIVEDYKDIFDALIQLSENGDNLRFVIEDENEKYLFEKHFSHVSSFVHELGGQIGVDESLMYREDADKEADEYFVFYTYFKAES